MPGPAGPSTPRRSVSPPPRSRRGSTDARRSAPLAASQLALSKGSMRGRAPMDWATTRNYAVMVDAGSSGSRLQVYSWRDPNVDRAQRLRNGKSVKVLPTVEKGTWEGSGKEWQLKVEPGISSFGTHPQDLASYLKPLLDHAASLIPASQLPDTPIYILATAGMRLLPAAQQKAVLQETCRILQATTKFKLDRMGACEDNVQIISGEDEGLLGWIAINYLMDGFHFRPAALPAHAQPPPIGAPAPTKGKSTFGFLDLGGASTQIAFEPAIKDATEDTTKVTLRMLDGTDVTSEVFVTTFLGYGTNKARERYITQLTADSTHAAAASSYSPALDPCLPDGLLLPQGNTTVLGTGSFAKCLASLEPLLDKHAACSKPPCLFHGVHVPPISFEANHFVGVSEYWFSSNDVFGLGGAYDFVGFQKAAQEFCQRPWKELDAAFRSGKTWGPQVDLGRLQMQCFKAAWMTTVLHEGIGLPRLGDSGGAGDGKPHADQAKDKADEKNLFQSVNDINGLAVSWTLGKAVLEATRDIPPPQQQGAPGGAPVTAPKPPGASGHNWADKWGPTWHRPADAVAALPKIHAGGHSVSGGAALLALLGALFVVAACCCLRSRRRGKRSRASGLRDAMPPPVGSCFGLAGRKRVGPRGDYVLASMEEGPALRHSFDEAVYDSDGELLESEGSEEADPRGLKPRRRSSAGLLAAVTAPLRRLLGMAARDARRGGASSSRRRTRQGARRGVSSPSSGAGHSMTMRSSRPDSPSQLPTVSSLLVAGSGASSSAASLAGGAISRPASRAGLRNANLGFASAVPGSTPPVSSPGTGIYTNAWSSVEAAHAPQASASPFYATTSGYTSRSASRAPSRTASPAMGVSSEAAANAARRPSAPLPLSRATSSASLASLATLTPRSTPLARRVSSYAGADDGLSPDAAA